jgi:hypothetical protein
VLKKAGLKGDVIIKLDNQNIAYADLSGYINTRKDQMIK